MMLFAVPAAAPDNILLPAAYDVVWSILGLLPIVALFIWMLPRVMKMLDERAELIEGGIKAGEAARAEAESLRAGFEEERTTALREFAAIREEAHGEAKAIVNAAQGKAQSESDRILQNANRQIEAERQTAEISLRTEVGLLSVELASRIVGEALQDKDLAVRVIDRFIADLESQNATAEVEKLR
ncbi:MAG: F0F1 ATP synthase subunit B [Ruaniaceae bacterium]|nr:F0F1 ATP synthase subunit B [Ruaniaceae bacterium]